MQLYDWMVYHWLLPQFNVAFFVTSCLLGILNYIIVFSVTQLGTIEMALGLIVVLEMASYATYFTGKATGLF